MALVESHRKAEGDAPTRIDRVVQELTGRARADVRGLFDHGCVRLNNEICTEAGFRVKLGDTVAVRHDPKMRYHEKPKQRENTAFHLVLEDEHLLVVDKSAALLTVPTDHGETNTLFDAIGHYLNRRGHRGRPVVVHRLDRGTSGLLVFAKNPRIASELRDQFRVRKADREYAALVAGTLEQQHGTFTSRLSTTKSLQRYSLGPGQKRDGQEGERAVTHFRVQQQLQGATWLTATLETGKRNQIRVHFAEAGHPVLGDERYRADLAHHPAWTAKRLALHAAVLGFEHPRSHKWLRFESPLPPEFERFLTRTRIHG
jgi:23S rRNA pseudouridine1911/1915/1917 synthase